MAASSRLAPLGASQTSRRAGAIAAVALHAAAALVLLSYEPVRTALLAAAPIMVELITPPKPEVQPVPPAPPVELPKPKPVTKVVKQPPKPVAPAPLITAPSEAPSPVVAAPTVPAAPAPALEGGAAASAGPAGSAGVTSPVFNADYLENPSPAYPPLSRRMREQGRVMLRVLVNPSGTADDVQIRTSSGVARLDEAAQETVRRWKFVPARRGSEAVSAWVLIPISFKLEG